MPARRMTPISEAKGFLTLESVKAFVESHKPSAEVAHDLAEVLSAHYGTATTTVVDKYLVLHFGGKYIAVLEIANGGTIYC